MDFLNKAFSSSQEQGTGAGASREDDLRVATCALFLEIANIDDEFSDEERASILKIIESEYNLTEQQALELARRAASQLEGSIDCWEFTNLINDNYNEEEKMRVVELLWRVVYADGKLEEHEDYLIHKLAGLLRLTHKQLIAAKLKVLGQSDAAGE
jgi:uncharacterized tellurite resistance protein B-like protein